MANALSKDNTNCKWLRARLVETQSSQSRVSLGDHANPRGSDLNKPHFPFLREEKEEGGGGGADGRGIEVEREEACRLKLAKAREPQREAENFGVIEMGE